MKDFLKSKLILSLVTVVMIATAVSILLSGTAIHSRAVNNVYYVSPTGSDSNSGTLAAPFATIEHADGLAAPGTTVHILPGTYTWSGVYTTHSGTATARIIFISDTKWGAKLVPGSLGSHSGYATWFSVGDYVDIVNFDITSVAWTGMEGIKIYGLYDRMIGNKIHDTGSNGISARVQGADTIGNLVYNTGATTTDHGIYYMSVGGHIVNNIVYNAAGYGISCWHACSDVTIANNVSFNNKYGGMIVGGGDNPNYANSLMDNVIVANNIVINNAYYGIREYVYPGQYTIGPHNQILNNNVYGNPSGDMVLIEGNTASGTVTSDAQFINYQANGSGDYHLQSTSPDIDTGTSTGGPSTDFDGNARPQGNGFDIGAYEYISSVSGTATPTNTPIPTATSTPTPTPFVDTTSPSVSITNPLNSSTVKRGSTVTINATASDNVGVTKVVFSVNGSLLCTDTVSPYSCAWSVPGKRNVTYIITVTAYDAAGNTAISQITVTAR